MANQQASILSLHVSLHGRPDHKATWNRIECVEVALRCSKTSITWRSIGSSVWQHKISSPVYYKANGACVTTSATFEICSTSKGSKTPELHKDTPWYENGSSVQSEQFLTLITENLSDAFISPAFLTSVLTCIPPPPPPPPLGAVCEYWSMLVANTEGRGGGEGVGDWPSGGLGALNIGNWEHIRAHRYTTSSCNKINF